MPCGDQEAPQSPTCLGQTSTTGLLSNKVALKDTRDYQSWANHQRFSFPGRLLSLLTWWSLRLEDQASFSMVSQTGFMRKRYVLKFLQLKQIWDKSFQVLSDTRAIWFSPDGDKIAWTQFNDTDVSMRNILLLLVFWNDVVCSDNDEDKTKT